MPKYDANDALYNAAKRFVDSCLRHDDSLFTPGRSIWSLPTLEELDRRYVQNPDLGSAPFEDKLRGQLSGASADAIQLMAEILFVYYLPARGNINGDTKRQKLEEILSWSSAPVSIPPDLAEVLDHGVGSGGPGFHLYKWASVSFLISFARLWKQASQARRDEALGDPWQFRDFVGQVPNVGGGIWGRESLLYLVFPDTFERIFSGQDKQRLTQKLASLVTDPTVDLDRQIHQIRERLSARFGADFDFYSTDGVRALWKRFDTGLDEFIYWASRFYELDGFDAGERTYKLDTVTRLTAARSALVAGEDWFPLLKHAFTLRNNLTAWQVHDTFLRWCQADLDRAAKLMKRIWDGPDEPLSRLADFFVHLPRDEITGLGSRTTLGSFLLFALDPYGFPPYRVAAMHAAYRLTGEDFGSEKDEVAMYRRALAFFDKLRERSAERGLELRDRLDAQSVVWCITNWPAPEEWPAEDRAAFARYRQAEEVEPPTDEIDLPEPEPEPGPQTTDALIGLADELLLDYSALREISELLAAKGQLVFYGPPGTGKTFVARKFAAALAGDPGRVRLVQFHPSYSYEDFVEGYRPRLTEGGQATFELIAGPLKTLAKRAVDDPGHDYYLIIDEINRGNIAKVFGELYFLLEYRDEEIQLQYSPDQPFRLPGNLRLIGTMNTADRSIALLDAALRRRFSFVPFFPDRQPVAGLLGRWLQRHRPDMAYVAQIVDAANARLNDRNAAIGPSLFLKKDLDATRLSLIWQHEILPLLEDYFFDTPERISEFQLDVLRQQLAGGRSPADGASAGPVPGQTSGEASAFTEEAPLEVDATAPPA